MPLSQPPRDAAGEVIPHDHGEIGADDRIIRRISAQYIVPDPKVVSGRRIASFAFQNSTDGNQGMSVDLEQSILGSGLDPVKFVTTPIFMGSLCFKAGYLRSEMLKVGYDPLPENIHHGEVWGNLTKGLQNRLIRAAEWYVKIENVDLRRG